MTSETQPPREVQASSYADGIARSVLSESAIYGVIVVSALVVIAGTTSDASWDVFWKVLGTVLVFFIAHAFATVVSHLGLAINGDKSLGGLVVYALRHSSGLLLASTIPLVIILLGATGILSDDTAVWTALWVDVVLLGIIGFVAVARMTRQPRYRALGAALTSLLGLVIMAMKVLIH